MIEIIGDFDAKRIVHPINLMLGDDLVGIELGTHTGLSACGLVQNCPSIKTLYTIDNWKAYDDFIGFGMPSDPLSVNQEKSTLNKNIAEYKIKYCGLPEKVVLLEKDTQVAYSEFEDDFFDFIFFDSHLTGKQLFDELEMWYPKCKSGALISGHDWMCNYVQEAVYLFRVNHNITGKMSVFGDTFIWIKE